MFKKIKSLFSRSKPKAEKKPKNIQVQIGEAIYPILKSGLKTSMTPEGMKREDWKSVKEQILWSFSALRSEQKPLNNTKRKKEEKKIKKGLILFANNVDNFKI